MYDAFSRSMMQLCPSDRTVDVKKSTYKKVGKFLEAMQQVTSFFYDMIP